MQVTTEVIFESEVIQDPEAVVFLDQIETLQNCEIRTEIVKYSKLIEKITLDKIHMIFQGVLNGKNNISSLVSDITDDASRSVANRLAYLLILSKEEFGLCSSRTEALSLIPLLMQSATSTFY